MTDVTQSKKVDSVLAEIDILLTNREIEILGCIGSGLSTRQIAIELNITTSTVGTYRERIKKKLNIYSPNELIRYAVQWSLSKKNEA